MAENQRIYQDRTFRLAAHRNVLIAVWSDAPTLAQARILHREADQFTKRNAAVTHGAAGRASAPSAPNPAVNSGAAGPGQAFVNMVTGGVPVFSEPVREELVKVIKSTNITLGAAHILLVSGMAGSAVRAFLSTVLLVARPKAPNRVFAEVPDAVSWLLVRLGGTQAQWTGNELRDAIEAARRDR